ncbi:hypothetical protein [Methylovorus mays]|uniref:hypothetical protein n=1 Tax=Methylovorus mays TaxID=184077 RepID=UPI001E34F07A|nr:hypothetical protein [Methylovorus mays]MCB5206230.1 hypothetical protein [Methylovorus mays]
MKNQRLLDKVSTPNHMYAYCRIMGCSNSASAGTDSGLNRLYCRKHQEHYSRHGSYIKKSYTAKEIDPYRKVAMGWLKANLDDPVVDRAIKGIEGLYKSAGRHVEAFRLSGLPPQERARAAWARLRDAGIDPTKPLAAWIAVELIFLDDPQSERKQHFRWVQGAKIIHRLASGSHKRWERQDANGKVTTLEFHKYPRSRGRVLVHLGEQLHRVAELLVSHRLGQIRSKLAVLSSAPPL